MKPGELTQERKDIDLQYLKEMTAFDQQRQDSIAAERGWSTHPNDMELEGDELKAVLQAWSNGEPEPDW